MKIDWEIFLGVLLALIAFKLIDQFLLSRFLPASFEEDEE